MQDYWMGRLITKLSLIFILGFVFQSFSQSDEQSYSEEFNYGINFNTNAGLIGGFFFKWAKANGPKRYHNFGFEVVNVKHPKENRFRNDQTGNSFLAYKTNYLFVIRPFYGQEFVLFRKAAEEGVHINGILAGGPSIGLLKPYYILYLEPNGNPNTAVSVPYTEDLNLNQVYGVGNLTDGLNEMKITLGVHAKASLSFEFGQIKNSVFGMETGFLVEQFTRTQKIMAFTDNRKFFYSAFFTLYYGRKY
jgi:hypothetical protein